VEALALVSLSVASLPESSAKYAELPSRLFGEVSSDIWEEFETNFAADDNSLILEKLLAKSVEDVSELVPSDPFDPDAEGRF